MDLELKKKTNATSLLLYRAQLIANTFAKGLEDNECLLVIPVALHQELKQNLDEAEKTVELEEKLVSEEENRNVGGTSPIGGIYTPISTAASAKLKNSCFQCKFQKPKLKIESNFKFSFDKLKVSIDTFKLLFEKPNIDPCQALNLFKFTCLPDILKLLSMLLTAYIMIMSSVKILNISLTGFIQGIIRGLMSTLVASVKINLDIGQSNIQCIINIVKDIAKAIPSDSEAEKVLTKEEYEVLNTLKGKIGLQDEYEKYAGRLKRNLNKETKKLEDNVKKAQKEIDETFRIISETVSFAEKKFNSYIENLLGLQEFLKCEQARSGSGILEIAADISKLQLAINLISSIAYAMVKKDVRGFCKNDKAIKDASGNEFTQDDLFLKDFLDDYYQNVTEINTSSPDNVEILVYNKPKNFGMPKISLLDCKIDDFIKEHNLDNIIDVAEKDVTSPIIQDRQITDKDPWSSFTFPIKSLDEISEIKEIFDLLYTKPPVTNIPQPSNITAESFLTTNYNIPTNFNSEPENKKTACTSIEDVLNIIENFKGNIK